MTKDTTEKEISPFYGIFAAIATPFAEGELDEPALRAHLAFLLEEGIAGVIPCGTTGESIALSLEERGRIIQICLEVLGGKARVIPGTGAATLAEALIYTQQAERLGADGALVVSPYYVKADLEGVRQFYHNLHDATDIPLILYSNPGRTGFELPVTLIEQLAVSCPRICGLKDSSTDLTRPLALKLALRRMLGATPWNKSNRQFALLSGEDGTFGAFLAQGGDGIISVGANVAPRLYGVLMAAWQRGDLEAFARAQDALFPLTQTLFRAPSPGPLKYALSLRGFANPAVRLPLGPLSKAHQQEIQQILKALRGIT